MPVRRAVSPTTLRGNVALQTAWRILDIRCVWFQTDTPTPRGRDVGLRSQQAARRHGGDQLRHW